MTRHHRPAPQLCPARPVLAARLVLTGEALVAHGALPAVCPLRPPPLGGQLGVALELPGQPLVELSGFHREHDDPPVACRRPAMRCGPRWSRWYSQASRTGLPSSWTTLAARERVTHTRTMPDGHRLYLCSAHTTLWREQDEKTNPRKRTGAKKR